MRFCLLDTTQKQPQQLFYEIGILKSFATFTGKRLCWNLFLITSQALGPTTLLKKAPTHVFSCEYCKILKYICKRLLLTTVGTLYRHLVMPGFD